MGIEEKRLALKRARLEAARAERPEYQPEQTLGDTLKGLGKDFVEGTEDFSSASADAAPFSGILDKAASAGYAGAQKVGDLFRDNENQHSFGDYYDEDQASRRQVADAMAKRSPIANVAGAVTGAATSLTVPTPGANMSGIGGVAARVGGNSALAALDQGTRGKDLWDSDKAKQAATIAGALGLGGEAISAAATPIKKGADYVADKADELGDFLTNLGERRAYKAVTGNQAAAYDEAVRKGMVNKYGRDLLDSGVVEFGDKARGMAQKAVAAKKEAGDAIGSVIRQVDEAAPNAVSGASIAEKARDFAKSIDSPANRSVVDKILAQADEFESMGNISMREAQRLKRTYRWDPRDPAAMPFGKEATNFFNQAIGGEMEDAVGRLASKSVAPAETAAIAQSGTGPVGIQPLPGQPEVMFKDAQAADFDPQAALDLLKSSKQKFGTMETASKNATKLANRQEKNRTFSLGDLVKGGIGSVIGGPKGAIAAAAAGKLARERGSSAMAVTLDKAGQLLNQAPELLGKYAPILENAAKRGNAAFTATHYMLMNTDPDYRNAMEGADGSN